jgi:hypothetical protein
MLIHLLSKSDRALKFISFWNSPNWFIFKNKNYLW